MIPKVFTFLFLIFLLNRTQAAPYYYQSIGADFYKPEDKIFYSLIKPTWIWGGLLRDAQFAYAKKLAGPFPEPQLSAEELSWQAEARDWISSWMNFQGGREALEIHLVQIMDSPQTSTRLRSLAEHFFLSQSNGWIETYNNFNDFGSIKKHLLRAIFLKTLLYGSGKTDTEKLALIDNLLQKINTFHSEMDKGQIGRHLRLATEKDKKEILNLFSSGTYSLDEEFQQLSPRLSLPAGILGNEYKVRELHQLLFFAESSKAFTFKINLYEIDSALATRGATELAEKFRQKIQETYEQEVRKINRSFKHGTQGSSAHRGLLKTAETIYLAALSAVPRRVISNLKNATIDLLIDPDGIYRKYFIELTDQAKISIFDESEKSFKKQWQKIRNIGNEIALSNKLEFQNKADQRFFEILLSSYFSQISYEESKNILKAFIERPDQEGLLDLFRIMVLRAGPQMQKLLQVLGQKNEFSEGLRAVFRLVEESGLAAPWASVEEKLKEPPQGTKWVSINKEPKVGTMAQTYKCVIKDQNDIEQEIAARVLKPQIIEKLESEEPKMLEVARNLDQDPVLRAANFPLIDPILADIRSMTADELDISKTKRNQIRAESEYRRTVQIGSLRIDFNTPKTYQNSDSDVLFSSWAPGEDFNSFAENNPKIAIVAAESLVSHWFQTALYAGLFFHPDLHQGNFKIRLVSPNHIEVSFLDFGMIGELTALERNDLLKLSVVKYLRSEKQITHYLWALSNPSKNRISKADLFSLVAAHPEKFEMDGVKWVEWGLSKGIIFNTQITAFSRGKTAIEQLLFASGSKKKLTDILGPIALKNYKISLGIVKDSVKDLFSKEVSRKENLPLNKCSQLFTPMK